MADKSEAGLDGKTLHSLRVVDLRSALEKRGLPKSGSKKELVERLKLQLKIEKLHEESVKVEDRVPNLDLQDELAGQNDFVRQYLAAQQQTYAMQLKERRLAEMEACCSARAQADSEEATSRSLVLSSTGDEKGSCRESWECPCEGRTCPSSIDPGGAAGHSPTQGKPPKEIADPPVETCRSRLRHQRPSYFGTVKRARIKPSGQGEPKQGIQPEPKISSCQNKPSSDLKVQRVVRSPRKGAVAPAISPPPIEEHHGQRYPSRRKREQSASEGSAKVLQRSEHTVITITDEEAEHDFGIHPATSATEQLDNKEYASEKHAHLARQSQELKIGRRTARRAVNTTPAMAVTWSKGTANEASSLESCSKKTSNRPTSPHRSSSRIAELNSQGTSNLVQYPVVEGSEEKGKPLRMLITRTGTTRSGISCSRVNMQSELLSENAANAHPSILFTQVPCDALSGSTFQSSVTKDIKRDQKMTPRSSNLPLAQVGDDLHETLNKLHITAETTGYKQNMSVQHDALPILAATENSTHNSAELVQNDETLKSDSTSGKCSTNTEQAPTFQGKKKSVHLTVTATQGVEIMAAEQELNASPTSLSEGCNAICTDGITSDTSASFARPSSCKSMTATEMKSGATHTNSGIKNDSAIECAADKGTATSSAEESVQPAAVATQEAELAVQEQEELSAYPPPGDGDNASVAGNIMADTSTSPSRPSVRRSLTAAETTSAVQSILQTTEEILDRSEHCHDIPDAGLNLIDEDEVGSATDSLLKEMSIGTEDENDLQLTATCLERPEQVETDDMNVTPTEAAALYGSDGDGNRGSAAEEINKRTPSKSPDNRLCFQIEPSPYKTPSGVLATRKMEHASMLSKDELSVLERPPEVSLLQARKLGQIAEVKTSYFSQSSDAKGFVLEANATKLCSSSKESTHQQKASEQSISEKSTASATECLVVADSAKSLDGTSHTVSLSEASAHNETRKPVGDTECFKLSRAKILDRGPAAYTLQDPGLPPGQKAEAKEHAQGTGARSSSLETPAASLTIAALKVCLPENQQAVGQLDGAWTLKKKLSSDCYSSACETRTAMEGFQNISLFKTEEVGLSSNPFSEYPNAEHSSVAYGTNAFSLKILQEMQNLCADAAEKDSPSKISATSHLNNAEVASSQKLSSDGAAKSAMAVGKSLCDEQRLCLSSREQPAKNPEAVVKSLCADTRTTARSEGCSTCTTEYREDPQLDTSTFALGQSALVINEQDAHTDTGLHHALNDQKLPMEADAEEVLSQSSSASIASNDQCSSTSTELSSLTKIDLNEHIQEATAKTKVASVVFPLISTRYLQMQHEASLEKVQDCKADNGHEIPEKAAAEAKSVKSKFCNDVGAANDCQRLSQHPDKSVMCSLALPQDTERQGEIPREAIILGGKTPLKREESKDENALVIYDASHETGLSRSKCTEIFDEHDQEFPLVLVYNREAYVKLDSSNDVSNTSISDRAVTSSVPMITASVAPVNLSAECAASTLHETCAETTAPCKSDASFTVAERQHLCQGTSSFGSCDSTTESYRASQHSMATSSSQMKHLLDISGSTNAVLSTSEIIENCGNIILAPDSTEIESSAVLHASSADSCEIDAVSPACVHSASSNQGTQKLTVGITPCSQTVESAAPCQFSPPHTVTNTRSATAVQYAQDYTQVLTTLDKGASPKQGFSVVASVDSNKGTVHNFPLELQVRFVGALDNCGTEESTFQEENLSNTKKCICSDENNSASIGQKVPVIAEVKEGLKCASETEKQSPPPVHICHEVEDAAKLKGATEVFSGVVSNEYDDKEIKCEQTANTQVNVIHSVKDNTRTHSSKVATTSSDGTTNEPPLERAKSGSFQIVKEHTVHDSTESKQKEGRNDGHVSATACEHHIFTKSVIMFSSVHEIAAPSQGLLQESMDSLLPEHPKDHKAGGRESIKKCENTKDCTFENLSKKLITKSNEETMCETGFNNTAVGISQAIHEEVEMGVLINVCQNSNTSAHSRSAVLEDENGCQDVETTATSQLKEIEHSHTDPVNMTSETRLGLCTEDCSGFHSITEMCFAKSRITQGHLADELPGPCKTEASRSSFVHRKEDNQSTANELSCTNIRDNRTRIESPPKAESSLAMKPFPRFLASECEENLQREDVSTGEQVADKCVLKMPKSDSEEHNCTVVMNSSVNKKSSEEHCALLVAGDMTQNWECEACVQSNSTSTGIHLGRLRYDCERATEEMDETGGSNICAPGPRAEDVVTDVAATHTVVIRSKVEPQEDDASSYANAAQSSLTVSTEISACTESAADRLSECSVYESCRREVCDPCRQYSDMLPASTCFQCDTRETSKNVLGLADSSRSSTSSGTSCSESEEHQMARLRGRGVRKQVTTRATKEPSEASSDGEGNEAGNRRVRNGRRATPEDPVVTRRSPRNRKAATEGNPKEDSDAVTEPESTPGSPQPEEEQELSLVQEEEQDQPQQQQEETEQKQHVVKKSSSSSTSESSDSSDGEEEPVVRRGLKGVLALPPGRHQPPPEQPSSPPTSEPALEIDMKEQDDVIKSQEGSAEGDNEQREPSPAKKDKSAEENVTEDVEMKDDEEKEPASEASAPKFKTRRLSTAALKKDSEDKEERPQRKRRWGSTNVVLGPSLSISTAALKDLIPDIEEPLSKPKEPEEEHVTASVGESPVTEVEEASDEPPLKLQIVDEEPTSEDVPPGDDSTGNGQEIKDEEEPSQDEKLARSDREKSKDDRPSRSERFSRDEKERPSGRNDKGVKIDKPVKESEKHERRDARVRESKPARDKASPITAPGAERKTLRVISDRAPLSKRSGGSKDEADKRKLASPPRNPKSRVLFVRNLVRPFTLNQLKQLLQEFGDTVDSEFWIDKIKSKCFVTYMTEEDAVKAREALHNLRWPLCNPKILHVDFSSPEEMTRHKEPPAPPPRPAGAATGERTAPAFQRTVEVDTHVPAGREVLRDPREVLRDPRESRDNREPREPKDPREARGSFSGPPSRTDRGMPAERQAAGRRPGMPMREWDRDKVRQETPPPPPAERAPAPSRNRPHSPPEKRERRDKKMAKRKPEEDTPAKLLDDLFRKTKASPCIYWLPLTEEQVARKEEERKQRRQERERRRQQQQLQEEEERRKRALAREIAAKAKQESKRSGSRSPLRRR